MIQRIEKLLAQALDACLPWVQEREGALQFVDPLEDREISAHYGATHAAAAFLLYGQAKGDEALKKRGEALLGSVLDRWASIRRLPGFHNDFNSFALCVAEEAAPSLRDLIRQAVLSTPDSPHDTVNWLPMRWYVNRCRHQWTGEKKYLDECRACADKIRAATYPDGFLDDRLPKGLSFNLQYDAATVAVLQFLRVAGEEIDIGRETGALLSAVCPDGDINYLGRGANQVFAWGLWVYLLASGGLPEGERALRYLADRLPTMLKCRNLMLNDFPGEEKYLWWDYHFCSVYTAHLLFWLTLAWRDAGKMPVWPVFALDGSSGVHLYRSDSAFAAVFDGRTEYLAERGPVVAALWTKKSGVICKGAFGPWQGAFGREHMQTDATLRNFVGMLQIDVEKDWSRSRLVRKLLPGMQSAAREAVRPVFCPVEVCLAGEGIDLTWCPKPGRYLVNLPLAGDSAPLIRIQADGRDIPASIPLQVRNPYGWVRLLQAKADSPARIDIHLT